MAPAATFDLHQRTSSLLVCMRCHTVYLLVVYSTIGMRKLSLMVSRNLLDCLFPAGLSLQWLSGCLNNPMRSRAAPIHLYILVLPVRQPRADLYLPPLILTHKLSLVSSSILWHSCMPPGWFHTGRARPIPLCTFSFRQSLYLCIVMLWSPTLSPWSQNYIPTIAHVEEMGTVAYLGLFLHTPSGLHSDITKKFCHFSISFHYILTQIISVQSWRHITHLSFKSLI